MVQLFVRRQSDTCGISIDARSSVGELTRRVGCDRLYWNAKRLPEQATIEECGIPENATIDAVVGLKGGMNPFKIIPDMLKMIINMIQVLLAIIKLITKPVQMIMLIIALFVVCIMYLIYFILSLPGINLLVMFVWFLFNDILPFVAYCIIFTVILVVVFIACVILSGINGMLGGALRSIVLCQRSPTAWYSIPNFQLLNRRERMIFCSRPCFSPYAPDTSGLKCVRTAKGSPPYCPQAEAMRIFSRKNADRNDSFKKFNEWTNLKYMMSIPENREVMLKDYYLNKKKFKETCSQKMEPYDPIALSICSSADSFDKILDAKQIAKLKKVCAQAYCTAEKNYPFCAKTSNLKEDDDAAIVKKIVSIVLSIMILSFVLIFTFLYLFKRGV